MATEKIINTRIQLKYDTLANLESSNPVLKAGEVAIIAIASGNTQTVNSVTAPQCLMKVGDGTSNFKALPYTSALAADVYSWAKKSESEFITWVNQQVTHPTIPDGFTIAVNVTDDDVIVADLKGGKNSVSGSITHAQKGPADGFTGGAVAATAEAYGESVTIKVPKLTVDAYGHVNSASDVEYKVAIPAAQDLSGYATNAALEKVVDGTTPVAKATNADKLDGQAASYYATASSVTDIVNGTTKVGKAENADDSVKLNGQAASYYATADSIANIVNGTTKVGKAETADKVVNSVTITVNGTSTVFDGSEAQTININAAALGLESAMHFIGALSSAPETAKAGDVYLNTATKKEYVYDETNGWVELGDEGSHVLKSVKIEGTGYLTGGGTLEDNRTIDINTETKTKIDNGATAYGWGNHASQGYLKAGDISGKADKVSDATSGNFAGLDANGNLTDSGKKASDFATSAQGSTADSALQSVKVLGTTLTKSSNELTVASAKTALGLKSAAYTESSAYATAAQGGKADSALQTITTTANGGLKVTNKNQIDIDTDVVFVFNCGSASVLVD